ncbi:MAG: family 16 glycosylhydrolase [Pseudomonadota bacterium]
MIKATGPVFALSASGLAIVAITGCAADEAQAEQDGANVAVQGPLPDRIERGQTFTDDMSTFRRKRWYISDGWSNGDYAMNDWRKGQSEFNGSLTLTMGTNRLSNYPFSSGEVQSRKRHGHGYFETTMRAAKGSGLVSGFFTYTGPAFKKPWNEIDVEILGVRPGEVQFSVYYHDDKFTHVHKLGFDASEGFHTYGFDWQPGYIDWYVDGEKVFRATATDITLPDEPQKIYMNLLGSRTLNRWAGNFDETALPATVEYTCVAKTESAETGQPCWDKQKAKSGA